MPPRIHVGLEIAEKTICQIIENGISFAFNISSMDYNVQI